MTKFEFLTELRAKLWSIPHEDAERSVEYYREMIDDRMEEGFSEEEAVAAVGEMDEIVKQILAEAPAAPVVREEAEKRRGLRAWEIVLLILGSPVWVPLLVAAIAVVVSVWVSLWSVVISLYAAFVALAAAAVGCAIGSFFMIGSMAEVMVAWGAALLCAGLAILLLILSNLAAKGMAALTKLTWNYIFHRKERTV